MNDNNKMLERVLLMMKYDSSKTLTENSDVVRHEFAQQLNEAKIKLKAPPKTSKLKGNKSVNKPTGGLGLKPAQLKQVGTYANTPKSNGKLPTSKEIDDFALQLQSGKVAPVTAPGKSAPKSGTVNVNAPATSKVTVTPQKGARGKGKPSPKDAGILSKFTGSVKKYPWRYALGLGLTGLGVWYFLKDNTEVSPCLLDSLTEEEMAALNGAGTSGTITRAQVGNRLADLNGGLIFSLDKPDVVTANGKYKGTYSCDGGALKISIAGSEFMLGAGTPSADTGTGNTGGTGGQGGGGRYTQCPETLPIAMYCKNSTIARVQGCVGAKQDGAFGPNTSAALVAKGADGSSITQASIDKVCGGEQPEKEKDPASALSDDFSGQKSISTTTGAPSGDTGL
jgi:hypothetical protein